MKDCFLILGGLLILFSVVTTSLAAQSHAERDTVADIINVKTALDSLNKDELFALKKELLLFQLNYQQRGTQQLNEIQWQLRIIFLLFMGSFLTLCITSDRLINFTVNSYAKWIFAFILFGAFFMYDAQLGRQQDKRIKYAENVKKLLSNLEHKSYSELKHILPFQQSENKKFLNRMSSRFSQLKKIDYFVFYFLTALLWESGWFLKKRLQEKRSSLKRRRTAGCRSKLG